MDTGRARERSALARFAVAGALALLVLFAGAGLVSATAVVESPGGRVVIAARETKSGLIEATSTRSRGDAWVTWLCGSFVCAALGLSLLLSILRRDHVRGVRRCCFRLRAPPPPVVAH